MKLRKYSKIIECRIYIDNAEKTESDNKQNMIKNGMHILIGTQNIWGITQMHQIT